jgi:hypothetical protein
MLTRPQQFVLGITLLAVCVGAIGSHASAADLRIAQDNSTISIFSGDQLVLHYRYADVAMKPYADQLLSPAGVQVLRDSPGDHKHHHGLMYAVMIDGVNFWEEVADSGQQRHKSLGDVKATTQNGAARAGFVEELDWMGPASDKPMMTERRTINVVQTGDPTATLVNWQCRFATPPGKDAIAIGGKFYHGLGMRFLPSMDTGGRFMYADDAPGEKLEGELRLTPAKWCAYTAKADGKPVTIAVFDHPANLRHPATMFTMTQPFAYLSATLNESKEPITVKADKPLDLCYGVALWDGEADRAMVENFYHRWLALFTAGAQK